MSKESEKSIQNTQKQKIFDNNEIKMYVFTQFPKYQCGH